MKISRHAAWIAFFAMVMAALSPSVTQLFATNSAADRASLQICSPTGVRSIHVDLGSSDSPADHRDIANPAHCPFCSVHGGTIAVPTSEFDFPLLAGTFAMPELFYQASVRLFVWASSQPRAPPALS